MNESEYKSLPDYDFRTQYDVTPRQDADVAAALRGEYGNTTAVAGAAAPLEPGTMWISPGAQRLR